MLALGALKGAIREIVRKEGWKGVTGAIGVLIRELTRSGKQTHFLPGGGLFSLSFLALFLRMVSACVYGLTGRDWRCHHLVSTQRIKKKQNRPLVLV